MARVTVEDCIVQVPNRFELVMYAAQRARDVSAGAQITVDRDRDKVRCSLLSSIFIEIAHYYPISARHNAALSHDHSMQRRACPPVSAENLQALTISLRLPRAAILLLSVTQRTLLPKSAIVN